MKRGGKKEKISKLWERKSEWKGNRHVDESRCVMTCLNATEADGGKSSSPLSQIYYPLSQLLHVPSLPFIKSYFLLSATLSLFIPASAFSEKLPNIYQPPLLHSHPSCPLSVTASLTHHHETVIQSTAIAHVWCFCCGLMGRQSTVRRSEIDRRLIGSSAVWLMRTEVMKGVFSQKRWGLSLCPDDLYSSKISSPTPFLFLQLLFSSVFCFVLLLVFQLVAWCVPAVFFFPCCMQVFSSSFPFLFFRARCLPLSLLFPPAVSESESRRCDAASLLPNSSSLPPLLLVFLLFRGYTSSLSVPPLSPPAAFSLVSSSGVSVIPLLLCSC